MLVLPMLGALALWSLLAFVFWDAWIGAVRRVIDGTAVTRWLGRWGAAWLVDSLVGLVIALFCRRR